jgi:membrane-associated protease RseP (regulator of RpoE activity)
MVSVLITGVVRRLKMPGILLLAMTAGGIASGAHLLALHDPSVGEIPRQAILRIYLSKKSDVFVGGRLLAKSKIHEVVEFRGVLLSRGYVVSYVGNYLPELSFPEVDSSVETWEGARFPAQPVAVDERLALIFLKTDLSVQAVRFSSEEKPAHFSVVSVGDSGWEIAHPCLYSWQSNALLPTSKMKVSGLNLPAANWLGGIVLDLQGSLVGVVSEVAHHLTSKNLSYFYLIPALEIETSYSRMLKEKGDRQAGWLGVNLTDSGKYLTVTRVLPNSPAEQAGLQAEDRLLKLNNVELENLTEFSQAIRWMGPDSDCHLTVERKGRINHLQVKLSTRQHENLGWSVALPTAGGSQEEEGRMRIYRTRVPPLLEFGLVIERLTSRAAAESAALTQGALLVQQVLEGSRAQQVGLRVGDIIFQVNGHLVTSVEDVQQVILGAQGPIQVGLVRDGRKMALSIQIHEKQPDN